MAVIRKIILLLFIETILVLNQGIGPGMIANQKMSARISFLLSIQILSNATLLRMTRVACNDKGYSYARNWLRAPQKRYYARACHTRAKRPAGG
jgi:hypothetical protein